MEGQQSRRGRYVAVMRGWRLVAVVVVLALAVVVGVAVVVLTGPPSKQDLLEQAGMVGKRELMVGAVGDVPGVSLFDQASGQWTGFDVDIAYLVAADLGFRRSEVRFVPIETEDRAKMQAQDGDHFVTVDLVVSTFSITAEREALPLVSFSAPYLLTEQSVITRSGHPPVRSLSDLRGRPVCTQGTSTSQVAAQQEGVTVAPKNRLSECVGGVLDGTYEAATTDAAQLAGFVSRHPGKLMHHDIGLGGQEAWGVNTGNNEPLRKLVNLSLYHSLHDPDDHRWEDAFDRYLRPEQAANLPQEVAVDHQPDVSKVDVREWPWENAAQ